MSDLLNAARQALQAMEDAMYRADTHEFYDAKEALRQAIEQAEQQEPVGEIVQGFADLVAVSIPVMPPVGTKLYTAPPQRKPLTDEEIALIVGECAASAYRHDDFSFARAIERAHGIGGGQ